MTIAAATQNENIFALGASDLSEFQCSAERHLAKSKGMAAVLYQFACRLTSKNKGRYHASDAVVAEYFGVSRTTIQRAKQELERLGFFIPVMKGEKFLPNAYRVLTHDEWAHEHPGQCVQRIEMPWSGEDKDKLGMRLYNIAGARVKCRPRQLLALRNTGLGDQVIEQRFEVFMESVFSEDGLKCGRWGNVLPQFIKWLDGDLPDCLCERYGLSE